MIQSIDRSTYDNVADVWNSLPTPSHDGQLLLHPKTKPIDAFIQLIGKLLNEIHFVTTISRGLCDIVGLRKNAGFFVEKYVLSWHLFVYFRYYNILKWEIGGRKRILKLKLK